MLGGPSFLYFCPNAAPLFHQGEDSIFFYPLKRPSTEHEAGGARLSNSQPFSEACPTDHYPVIEYRSAIFFLE